MEKQKKGYPHADASIVGKNNAGDDGWAGDDIDGIVIGTGIRISL